MWGSDCGDVILVRTEIWCDWLARLSAHFTRSLNIGYSISKILLQILLCIHTMEKVYSVLYPCLSLEMKNLSSTMSVEDDMDLNRAVSDPKPFR